MTDGSPPLIACICSLLACWMTCWIAAVCGSVCVWAWAVSPECHSGSPGGSVLAPTPTRASASTVAPEASQRRVVVVVPRRGMEAGAAAAGVLARELPVGSSLNSSAYIDGDLHR